MDWGSSAKQQSDVMAAHGAASFGVFSCMSLDNGQSEKHGKTAYDFSAYT
jgi:hypothetical protein